jgi:hypothetical protein
MVNRAPIQKYHRAKSIFLNGPWWSIVLFSTIIFFFALDRFLIPILSKREWTIPVERDVIRARGAILSGRIGNRAPYKFRTLDGSVVLLSCSPFLDRFNNCIDPSRYRSLENIPIDVEYFMSKDNYGQKNIILSLSDNGNKILPKENQIRYLKMVANIEDNDSGLRVFDLFAFAVSLLYIFGSVAQKILQNKAQKEIRK